MNVGAPAAPESRISAVRLYNVGILAGVILAPFFIGAATLGRGLTDPSLRGILVGLTILAIGACVALEAKVRRAYVAVAAGRLSWRAPETWGSRNKPVASISRIEFSPKGDAQIYFSDGGEPLKLSAKEFRREDLRELARALSAAAGRELVQSGPVSS
jgi:hypothetical protein